MTGYVVGKIYLEPLIYFGKSERTSEIYWIVSVNAKSYISWTAYNNNMHLNFLTGLWIF